MNLQRLRNYNMATHTSETFNGTVKEQTVGHTSPFHDRLRVLQSGNYLKTLMTTLRDQTTSSKDFRATVERVGVLLVAAGG